MQKNEEEENCTKSRYRTQFTNGLSLYRKPEEKETICPKSALQFFIKFYKEKSVKLILDLFLENQPFGAKIQSQFSFKIALLFLKEKINYLCRENFFLDF